MEYRLENGNLDIQSFVRDVLVYGMDFLDEWMEGFSGEDLKALARQALLNLLLCSENLKASRISRFGSSAEQLSLLEEEHPDPQIPEVREVHVGSFKKAVPSQKSRSFRMDFSHLPHIEEHSYSQGYDRDGNILEGYEAIGVERIEMIENQPSRKIVRVHLLHKAKRKETDENGKTLVFEPESPRLLAGSAVSASLLAELVSLKTESFLPEYRIAKLWQNQGFSVSPQTINGWFQMAGTLLIPLYERMFSDFATHEVVLLDETVLKIRDCDNVQSTVIVGCSGPFEPKQLRLYMARENKRQEFVADFLGPHFQGALMSDGARAYRNYAGCIHLNDFVHARRKFIEALEVRKGFETFKKLKDPLQRKEWLEDCRDKAFLLLVDVLEQFWKLFEIERSLKEKQADPGMILETRISTGLPVFETLRKKITALNTMALKKSKISRACCYFLEREEALRACFSDGRYPIDSNAVERTVKSFVIGRKNFLFCTSLEGARNLCRLYSVCQSALCNGLHLERYLTWVFDKLAHWKNDETLIGSLLPYSEELPSTLYKDA